MKTALLIVGSPLQVITGLEAVKYYGVTDYRMLVLKTDTPRHQHILNYLHDNEVPYDEAPITQEYIPFHKQITMLFKSHKTKYDYLIIGDYRNIGFMFNHISEVNLGGKIVFVDDGSATISILSGRYVKPRAMGYKLRSAIIKAYTKMQKITDNVYFTIFDDMEKNHLFHVDQNDMTLLRQQCDGVDENVYIVGTNILNYCEALGLDENIFYNNCSWLFSYMKKLYDGRKIIYIPHGRSIGDVMQELCQHNGIEYMFLDKCIELFFIDRKVRPFALYGYGSTALFTLKKIFPSLPTFNVFWGGTISSLVEAYEEVGLYYSKHNIMLLNQTTFQ